MPWFIVRYKTDPTSVNGLPSRTLEINADLLYRLGREDNDLFLEIEVRGNRAIVRMEGKAQKVMDLTGKYYRLPDLLDDKLSKADLLELRLQTLDMGYSDKEIDTAFPDGFANISLKDYINFCQSVLFQMIYDVKTAEVVESDVPRDRAKFEPKDPVEIDERVMTGKTVEIRKFEKRVF